MLRDAIGEVPDQIRALRVLFTLGDGLLRLSLSPTQEGVFALFGKVVSQPLPESGEDPADDGSSRHTHRQLFARLNKLTRRSDKSLGAVVPNTPGTPNPPPSNPPAFPSKDEGCAPDPRMGDARRAIAGTAVSAALIDGVNGANGCGG